MSTTKPHISLTTHTDTTDSASPWVLSYFAQRRIAGWIGICLPVVVAIITIKIDCSRHLPDSISASYYTIARNYFVGSLCAVGIFLIAGVGYKEDRILSFFAGAMAFLVAFSPCNGTKALCLPILQHTGVIHGTAAILLFLDFAWMCAFRFTLTYGQRRPSESSTTITPEKIVRNKIYRFCGGVMIVAMAVKATAMLAPSSGLAQLGHLTYTIEAICLIAFGFAWLVKGEQYFADVHPASAGDAPYKTEDHPAA